MTWNDHWQECADFCLPQKANITQSRVAGTKLKTDIFDGTAVSALPIFSAGLHSYLTNPTSRWFAMRMRNKRLMDIFEVRDWLSECEEVLFDYYNASNFNEVVPEWYVDLGAFGNSCLYEDYDEASGNLVFNVRPMSEIFFLVNSVGMIDTVYRKFIFTARQAYQEWGDNVGSEVKDKLEAGEVEYPIPFLHVVFPREERTAGKRDAVNMPYVSMYIEPKRKKVLQEGGYEDFPYFIPRFYKTSDSEYAYGPASIALSDVKMLNKMSRTTVEGAEKKIHPPIVLPNDGYLMPFKTSAKAINYKISGSADDRVEVLNMVGDVGLGLEMENQRRQKIERDFFVDLFLMLGSLPDKARTATEIVERVNERMLILGPALGRLMNVLSSNVTRSFNLLYRAGKLPQVPEILQGQSYKIDFISPLAKAQRAAESKSITDLLLIVGEMSKFDPQVMDNIDTDKVVKRLSGIMDTPTDILRSDEEKAGIRQSRAQQAQMAQELEMLKTGGEGAKTMMEAEKIAKEA
jgi:hypothetical protein